MVSTTGVHVGCGKTSPTAKKLPLDDVRAWYFVPVEVTENFGNNVRTFFMSRRRTDVYHYSERKTWGQVTGIHLELPRNTLVYGEIVKEI